MTVKSCIVTGGASGIGLQVATLLKARGIKVAIIDKDVADPDAGDYAVQADLTDSAVARSAFESCIGVVGGLDAAVNAAGVFGRMSRIDEISDEQLNHITFGNIRMCLFSMRTELEFMRRAGHGRIVNIASVAGSLGLVQKGDYCAAKHAIIGLTKAAALENAKRSIAVNSVSPGFVDTPMTGGAMKENPLLAAFIANQTPLGRSLAPASVASLICWLVAEAPLELTGADYIIDGGYSAR